MAVAAFLGSTVVATPAFATEAVPPPSSSAEVRGNDVPQAAGNRFIVKFRDKAGISAAQRSQTFSEAAAPVNAGAVELFETGAGASVMMLDQELDVEQSAEILAALAADPEVEYVEPDILLSPTSLNPDDPFFDSQWDLWEPEGGANVPAAWATSEGAGQVVAVVDTGSTNHSDLNAQMLPGYDLISSAEMARDGDGRDSNPQDEGDWSDGLNCGSKPSSWHGTHVAGTVAASTNNGVGISGVAPGAKIVPVRALGECGGYLSDIADGIIWAAGGSLPGLPVNANPANVINLSLSGTNVCSAHMQGAVDLANSKNAVVVVAAGNDDVPVESSTPANCRNVIAVGATGRDGSRALYSNHGSGVDIMAPGGSMSPVYSEGILSTFNAGSQTPEQETYDFRQGTSMAAPHVAGAAALLMAAQPGITPAQVEARLKATARDLPNGCAPYCGPKLLDVAAAVTVPPVKPAKPPFADVPVGMLFYNEILWLANEGISTGWPEANGTKTYRPFESVNRDAMAAFMYRLDGSPAYTPPKKSPFADVSTSSQFYKEIAWLNSRGISTGWKEANGTSTYRPTTPVNRDAMAAFMYRFAQSPSYTAPRKSAFRDVPASSQFYKEISWLASTGISTGWPDGTFRPVTPVARDAMAAFMKRFDGKFGQ